MQEPKLSDYRLTEELFEQAKKAEAEYKNACDRYRAYRDERDDKIPKAVIIVCIILFFVGVIVACVGDEESETSRGFFAIVLCSLVFIVPPVVSYNLSPKEGSFPSKSQFISSDLEKRINDYQSKKQEYEFYCMQQTKAYWDSLTGHEFEREVARLYRKQGYDAEVTRGSGDGGVDIILSKGEKEIAVQCKHHRNPVGPNDVRAFQGVVLTNNYDYGIFVSLSGFTTGVASEVAKGEDKVHIELVAFRELLNMARNQ